MRGTESSVGVLTTDRRLVVTAWDPWLVEATGIPAAAVVGQALPDLFPDLAERGLLERVQRVATDGTVDVLAPAFHRYLIPCPPRAPSAHFTRMQQHVTISPLRHQGEIAGVVITIEDVTSRLERERELAEQLASHDEAVRLRAAQALAEDDGGSPGEAMPALTAALADQSWRVRRLAARGLAQRGDDAVAALLEAIRKRHRDPAVINAALAALALSAQDVVPPVIGLLAAPDPDVRTYAAHALGQLEDPRAVAPLVRALEDADTNVRYHAVEALGRLRAREAAEPIAAIAESRDFFLAFAALDALGAIGEPSVAGRVLPLLEDDDLAVSAVEALGRFAHEEAVPALAALFDEIRVPAPKVAAALDTLYRRFEDAYGEGTLIADLTRGIVSPEGVQRLLAALPASTEQELGAVAHVLSWLAYEGIDRVLARLLAHDGVRKPVAGMLAARGASAIEALVAVLDTEDDAVRQAAAMALGRIGSASAVPALARRLDEAPEVAIAVAGALGSIGDRAAFEPLLALLDRPEAAVRQAAVSALSSIGHPDMPARIGQLLAHHSPRVRESAARVAGYFGYPHCLDRMLALARAPEELVRRAVVEHLAYFDDARAIRVAIAALRDESPGVRAAAARGLSQGPADALPALRAACEDPDAWVRYFAARALGRHGAPGALPVLTSLALTDPRPPVRIAAIDALGETGDARSASALRSLARDAEPAIAAAALRALGMGPAEAALAPEALALLRQALTGEPTHDADRQLAALAAVEAQRAAETVPAVASLARTAADRRVQQRAVQVLGAIATNEAIETLITLAADGRRREDVTSALARLEPAQTERLARWLRHPEPGVRACVVDALSRMRHRASAAWLVRALDDPAPSVRTAAAQALGRRDLRRGARSTTAASVPTRRDAGRHDAHDAPAR